MPLVAELDPIREDGDKGRRDPALRAGRWRCEVSILKNGREVAILGVGITASACGRTSTNADMSRVAGLAALEGRGLSF